MATLPIVLPVLPRQPRVPLSAYFSAHQHEVLSGYFRSLPGLCRMATVVGNRTAGLVQTRR